MIKAFKGGVYCEPAREKRLGWSFLWSFCRWGLWRYWNHQWLDGEVEFHRFIIVYRTRWHNCDIHLMNFTTDVIFVPFRSIINIHEHQHGHYQNDGDFKVEVPGNKPMPSSPEPPSNSSDRLRVLQVELFIICCLATSSSSSSSTYSSSSSSQGDWCALGLELLGRFPHPVWLALLLHGVHWPRWTWWSLCWTSWS